MKLKSIVECTTCQGRFAVEDEVLFGQIIACPQCGSMMNVPYPKSDEEAGEEAVAQPPDGVTEPPVRESQEPVGAPENADAPPVYQEAPPVRTEDGTLTAAQDESVPPVMNVPEPSAPPRCKDEGQAASETAAEGNTSPWRGVLPILLAGITLSLLLAVVITIVRKGDSDHKQPAAGANVPPTVAAESQDTVPSEPVESEPAASAELTSEPAAETTSEPVPETAPESESGEPEVSTQPAEQETPPDEPEDDEPNLLSEPEAETTANAAETQTEPDVPSETADETAVTETVSETAVTEDQEASEEQDETLDADFLAGARTSTLPSQTALPALNAERPKIDVDKGLATELESLVFRGKSVASSLQLLSALSGVPVLVDLDSLPLIRRSLATRLDLEMGKTTINEVITKTGELLNLTVERGEDRILLRAADADRNDVREKSYEVADLLDTQAAEDVPVDCILSNKIRSTELTRIITDLICPESWESRGGKGSLTCEGTNLTARQTPLVLRQIDLFLEQIRGLRQLPPVFTFSPEELIPEVLGREHLAEKVTIQYVEPVPLSTILDLLAKTGSLEFLIDYASLADAGIRMETPAVVRVNNGSLAHVLDTLLEPLGLSYIIISGNIIEITSKETASEYTTVEIHLFAMPGSAPTSREKGAELLHVLRTEVCPESWQQETGQDNAVDSQLLAPTVKTGGQAWCDPVSGCLIVRQSEEVQRAISAWLKQPEDVSAEPAVGEESKEPTPEDQQEDNTQQEDDEQEQ
ncbi:MAG: hypothetical protein Q4G68_07900 [Planctomycetia bacterium]|nr:hypothetical protein [Planctomycetia bacterium]